MNLVILGAPGSGKGTQAALLASQLGLQHLSTGDLLRDEIRCNSQLGAAAKQYVESGRLVPDEIIIGAMLQRLANASNGRGIIFDGFPRTVAQAVALEQALQEAGLPLPRSVAIEVPEEVLVRRLNGRLTCPGCHAVFHVDTKPPREDSLCDSCGSKLIRRPDEEPQAVRERFQVHAHQAEKVLSFYRDRGALIEVQGEGSPEEVNRQIQSALQRDSHDSLKE